MNITEAPAVERFVFEEAESLVRRIVRWRLGAASLQDREDVTGDVLVELLARIDSIGRHAGDIIADLAGYTAVAAHHGCDRYFRRRFPQRCRLATRVRYFLEHSPDYSLWYERDVLVCGAATHRENASVIDLQPGWIAEVALPRHLDEAAAVAAILTHFRHSLRFSDLTEALAELFDLRDGAAPAVWPAMSATERSPDIQISNRQILELLWKEIALLPRLQRVALLLNLRDDDGGSALVTLPATGIASMRKIAAAMEMPACELARIWKDLPLDDLHIAKMLEISRQQVINLRKSARKRLARRMSGNMERKPDSKRLDGPSV
jgi:DNA-directed RNA polymerase specialized sigma24 family protein